MKLKRVELSTLLVEEDGFEPSRRCQQITVHLMATWYSSININFLRPEAESNHRHEDFHLSTD